MTSLRKEFRFMMLRNRAMNLLPAALVLAVAGIFFAAPPRLSAQTEILDPATTSYTFTTFQPFGTVAHFSVTGLDNNGQVVGFYLHVISAKESVFTGYERLSNGTFNSLYKSGSYNTEAVGINSKGTTIVGAVCIAVQCTGSIDRFVIRNGCVCSNTAGFLLQSGAFTQYQKTSQTVINAINDKGIYVGSYMNPSTKLTTGFISNGITISYQGKATSLTAINDNGIVIGGNAAGTFKANETGEILGTFKFPGAVSTSAYGINNLGVVVGSFVDSSGLDHGFLLQKGTYTQVDAPSGTNTQLYGINDSGQIAGTYRDTNSKLWGFIATPEP